jgi:cytosine/adenosine deaminase-related metal-dependent hydrolase
MRSLRRRKPSTPFLIHLAEGTDPLSASEVARLNNIGGVDERTVAVHAVGIDDGDIQLFERSKASVVWCPSSNLFLFGKTAPVQKLSGRVPFALGTDSTLTGSVAMFDELRTARAVSDFDPRKLFELVTEAPQRIFGLDHGVGRLMRGGPADLFLLPKNSMSPFETLLTATPGDITLLMKAGTLAFFDPKQFPEKAIDKVGTPVVLNSRSKTVTDQKFGRLYKSLRPFLTHYSYLNQVSPAQ